MYNNELTNGVPRTIVVPKTFVHNVLQIFTILHYLGEFIANGMRQFMVGDTVDSILVKEGGVEINFLFHSICLIS